MAATLTCPDGHPNAFCQSMQDAQVSGVIVYPPQTSFSPTIWYKETTLPLKWCRGWTRLTKST